MAARKKTARRAAPRTGSAAANKIEKEFLLQRRIDDLSGAYVSLLAEIWILKDRQAVLEEVLQRQGIAVADAIENFEPSGAFKQRLDAERQAWLKQMVGAIFRKGLPTLK